MIASNLKKMYTAYAMRFLVGIILFLPSLALAACDSTTSPAPTTRAGIQKPAINSCSWGTSLNTSFDIIDSSFAVQAQANTFSSTNTFSGPILLQSRQPIRFYDDSTHFVDFRASQTVTSTSFVLPAADGTSGQVMKTDGAGNLSFTTASGGGASTLGVSQSSVSVTTPTVALNFIGPPFIVTAVNTSTAQVTLDFSSVTAQGNTFNQASKLVKLDSSSRLPAVDASLLTNISFSTTAMTVSTLTVTSSASVNYGLTTTTLTVRSTSTLNYTTMSTFVASSGTVTDLNATNLFLSQFFLTPNIEITTGGGFGLLLDQSVPINLLNQDGSSLAVIQENGAASDTTLSFQAGNYEFTGLTGNNFVKMNGSSLLTTYDLFGGTSTWTGANTFKSSTTLRGVTGSSYTVTAGTISNGPYSMTVSTWNHTSFQDFISSPVLTSCGTSPTIVGNDTVMEITPGATATGCVATFAKPYVKKPICTVAPQTLSLVNALSYTVTATAITISQTALTEILDVHCFGRD